ncbi:hypothetical protein WN48_10643 [Eufriesea mexicana]|uniref:Uncharacterized protein n=1 Tax=Eufriesea mexicana TaxID=516756 RepID=A0A310S6D3_9HYME|nr:hypothetical protein WN48_10643 [Eufriesea mexicana]
MSGRGVLDGLMVKDWLVSKAFFSLSLVERVAVELDSMGADEVPHWQTTKNLECGRHLDINRPRCIVHSEAYVSPTNYPSQNHQQFVGYSLLIVLCLACAPPSVKPISIRSSQHEVAQSSNPNEIDITQSDRRRINNSDGSQKSESENLLRKSEVESRGLKCETNLRDLTPVQNYTGAQGREFGAGRESRVPSGTCQGKKGTRENRPAGDVEDTTGSKRDFATVSSLSKDRAIELCCFRGIRPPAEPHRKRGLPRARGRGVESETLENEHASTHMVPKQR